MTTKSKGKQPAASGPEPGGAAPRPPAKPPPPQDHTRFLAVFSGLVVVAVLCVVLGFVLEILEKPGADQLFGIVKMCGGAIAGMLGGRGLR